MMTKQELYEQVIHNHKQHLTRSKQRIGQHKDIRLVTSDCAEKLVAICPESRELSLVLTKMEEAMFWANAVVARQEEEEPAVDIWWKVCYF